MEKNQNIKKKKIVIFGTGVSALTSAFELTDFPGWEELHEVTIYQLGWRAGGKTASSRGVNNRIQERGIHILQGWYWNMFRLVRRSYDERRDKKIDPTQKFQNWTDAVVKDDTTLLTTDKKPNQGINEWDSWPFIFPEDALIPGDASPISSKVLLFRILGIVCQLIFGSPYKERNGVFSFIPKWIFKQLFVDYPIKNAKPGPVPTPNYGKDPVANALLSADNMSQRLDDRPIIPLNPVWYILLGALVWCVYIVYEFFRILLYPLVMNLQGLNRFFSALEWILITTKGALQFCYDWKTKSLVFAKVNEQDYRVFLKKAGGSNMMIECGLVKFMYYGSFANLKGNAPGLLAADMAIRIVIDTIIYRGSLVWKTKAGTGGTIIAPIYQVLKARGVKFKFFHRISEIHYSESGSIEKVSLAEQVKLAPSMDEYAPLIHVNNVADWPESPLFEQIDSVWAEKLKAGNVDLESSWADWKDYRNYDLTIQDDFDEIILAIPVNALKDICKEIINKKPQWSAMVENVPTTQTFGAQVWISKTYKELGFESAKWGLRPTDEPNSVNYANLLYSWTDMTLLLEEEDWQKGNKPGDLAYYCGTMSDSQSPLPPYSQHSFPKMEYDRVFSFSKKWLETYMGWFFPKGTPKDNPYGLDFNLLMNPTPNGEKLSGDDLLKLQYFTANIDPSNRYTLAWPGTDKFRLKANESGFENLYLAGDWTNFGLNVGHLEGTCVSGIRAASALLRKYGQTSVKN